MARQVAELHERVEKAEAQLAASLGHPSSNQTARAAPSIDTLSTMDPLFLHPPEFIQFDTEENEVMINWSNSIHGPQGSTTGDQQMAMEREASLTWDMVAANNDHANLDGLLGQSNLLADFSAPTAGRDYGGSRDGRFSDTVKPPSDSTVPKEELEFLHKQFFQVWSPALPIIYEGRFKAELSVHQPSNSALCLSYAVALLGATNLPSHEHLQDNLLATSRKYLDHCETSQDGKEISLDLVQALILIFRHALAAKSNFSQARIALGRAIQFGKIFSLHQMDIVKETSFQLWHLRSQLQPTSDVAVLEERRRTFWALYIFDSYASTRTGMPCQLVDDNDDDFHVKLINLPSPGTLGPNFTPLSPPISLTSSRQDASWISSWAAVAVMVELAFRIFNHCRASHNRTATRGFWDRHYGLVKDVASVTQVLQKHLAESAIEEDSLALSLVMNLSAMEILLHETAILEAIREALPEALVTGSRNAARAASSKIGSAVKINRQSANEQRDMFLTLQAPFIGWPIYMAMKVLAARLEDQLEHEPQLDELENIGSSMALLMEALDSIEDHGGFWHTSVGPGADTLKNFKSAQDTGQPAPEE